MESTPTTALLRFDILSSKTDVRRQLAEVERRLAKAETAWDRKEQALDDAGRLLDRLRQARLALRDILDRRGGGR